ncbi:MAG: outer membrane protein assembly factor BamA, partial [Candidatus Omnitrophica bacterium]|nr:outer membrane protein assembly factor BamA [Candidatus Omnitrophota bacterium]
MKKIKIFGIALLLVTSFAFSLAAEAENASGRLVTKVEVKGNKNISSATILAKVRTRKGQTFSQLVSSDDLKRLYALGFFTDIKIDIEDYEQGIAVIFKVEELPIVTKVSLAGNKSIKTDKLKKLIKSKTEEFFSLPQLKQDMRDIRKDYEARGFPLASIDYEMQVDDDSNEAEILINIQEEVRVKIKDITVQGNKDFSDKKILKLMRTRRDSLFTSGLYREGVLDLDLERITSFYRQNGYLDIKASFEQTFGPDKKKMYIAINIDEGNKYLVGEVIVKGAVILPEKEITDRLRLSSGVVFSKDELKYDIAKVQGLYFEKGYIAAEVGVDTLLDEATRKINLVYNIIENELAYIDKIKIRGNIKTRDIVIRRELRSYPGEAFDGSKLTRSKERLYNLGFFQEISYDTEQTDKPNKRDLIVNVKEAKTGEFAFGAGFSSVERLIGFVEVAQRNFDISNWNTFTGAGQDLRVKAEFGTSSKEYELSFTEPWILGHPISLGIDAYNRSRERSGTTGYSYDEERRGAALRLGKELSELWRTDAVYRFENVDIRNVPDGASLGLRNEVGENTISSLYLGFTRDSRDNVFSPSRGLVLSCSGEVAGGFLGQDKDFYKAMTSYDYYKTVVEKLLFEFKVTAGGAETFSDTD